MCLELTAHSNIKEASLGVPQLYYRGIVIPKMNDMLFRRGLILHNSHILRRTLERTRDTLVSRFNDLYDFPNASLRRDMLLVFLSPKELESRLAFEVKNLPKIQNPHFVDTYSTILQLKKVQAKNPAPKTPDSLETSTADVIRDRLKEYYAILEADRYEKVSTSWKKYSLIRPRDEDDPEHIGNSFWAKDDKVAAEFLTELVKVSKPDYNGDKSLIYGMRALGYMEPDPVLYSDKYIKEEKIILDQIFSSNLGPEMEGISLLQRVELEEIKTQAQEVTPDTYDPEEEL